MKKILITFALFAMLTSAFAGPIDWMMGKLGYTPTAEIINQRQQAELEAETPGPDCRAPASAEAD